MSNFYEVPRTNSATSNYSDRFRLISDRFDREHLIEFGVMAMAIIATGAKVVDAYTKWKNAKTWRMEVKRRNDLKDRRR